MAAIEVGRVIVKMAGREATMKAVVVDLVDQNFVLISGGGISPIKRRRCNIKHIRPLPAMVDIKRGAKDEAIQKAIENADLKKELESPLQITI